MESGQGTEGTGKPESQDDVRQDPPWKIDWNERGRETTGAYGDHLGNAVSFVGQRPQLSCSSLNPQCLAQNRCLIHACWMNEQQMNDIIQEVVIKMQRMGKKLL